LKKIFILFVFFLSLIIIIPAVFTKPFETSSKIIIQKPEEKVSYDYKDFNKVKLLHTKTNEIEEVNLDEYLCNVVSAEMPATFELEALKAQAVVARTYTIYQIIGNKRKTWRSRYLR